MRQFTLYNALGNSYNLNDLDFFLENPEGLGFERSTEYRAIGSYYSPYREGLRQKNIRGTIGFKEPDAYKKYHNFCLFLEESPLRLDYTPQDDTFSIDVHVHVVEKTELELRGLNCQITIKPLGQFYKTITIEGESGESSGGKTYEYTYPYTYADSAPGSVLIESDTKEASACKLVIFGPLQNPSWTHYLNGSVESSGAISARIDEGHKLVIDTTRVPYAIEEQDASGNLVANRYGQSDFSTKRFIHIGRGANRITVAHEGSNVPRMIAEARLYYATV